MKELLPGWAGGELAETCSWADTQRFRYRWSSPLHFADTPGDCEFDYARKLEDRKLIIKAIIDANTSLKDRKLIIKALGGRE